MGEAKDRGLKANILTMKLFKHVVCAALLALSINYCQPSFAADAAQTAMAQFNAKQYKPALENFRKAIQLKPRDPNLYYYSALCQQYLGDMEGAKKTYMTIIKYFPASDAAAHAGGLIGVLERRGGASSSSASTTTETTPAAPVTPSAPGTGTTSGTRPAGGTGTQKSTPSGGGAKGNTSMAAPGGWNHDKFAGTGSVSAPDECNIHFERISNSLVVDAAVNYRPIKMIFDTGAENCAFGKNHLQSINVPPPRGKATGQAGGIGDGGIQETWDMPVTMTVGPITRKDFSISVQSEMGEYPLLGQTFFQDFTYTIDNGGNQIHVVRKNKQGGSIYRQANDPYAVPFTKMGNEMIVQALVNGKPCSVIFDTGANVCTFTMDQISKLGLSVPDDAQIGHMAGIAGATTTSIFPVQSIKVGPIEKRDFEIHVIDDKRLPAPLLGQTFFGDWQFTMDNQNQIIHFVRR